MDSAKIFLERSVFLLMEKGILSFVIPKPSALLFWEDLREYVTNLDITHCIDFGKHTENIKHEQIGLYSLINLELRTFGKEDTIINK